MRSASRQISDQTMGITSRQIEAAVTTTRMRAIKRPVVYANTGTGRFCDSQ